MQLYNLNNEREAYRKKPTNSASAQKRTRGKATKELQMIGAPARGTSRHRKIRADVVTKLDIIGEDDFKEEWQEKVRRQRIRENRERQRLEAYRERSRQSRYEYDDDEYNYYDNYDRPRRRKKKSILGKMILFMSVVIILLLIVVLSKSILNMQQTKETIDKVEGIFAVDKKVEKPDIVENYIDVNEYSRPGEALGKVHNLFVHYTANPGTTAMQNRDYFENLANTGETSASAHFVIGYDGEIIQCIPLQEIGYAVAEHNQDSISIECCYLDEDGHFTDATYQSLLQLTSWLMGEYHLSADDVLRHYDASGKLCPKYYVENENAWIAFKADLENYITANAK